MLKRSARSLIRKHAPSVDALLHARALRRYFRESFQERQESLKIQIYGSAPPKVLSGPFSGMTYLNEIVWGPIEPKWIGTYEKELWPVLNQVIDREYESIIDVGSAEGFYSVGLARLMPQARVYSFDVDPWGRAQQKRLAHLNRVKNITFAKFCRHVDLDQLAVGRTLVICDIEGHEFDLLDISQALSLAKCDILVELHPHSVHAATAHDGFHLIAQRFQETHIIKCIDRQDRETACTDHITELAKLSEADRMLCVDEMRDFVQCWAWLESKQSHKNH